MSTPTTPEEIIAALDALSSVDRAELLAQISLVTIHVQVTPRQYRAYNAQAKSEGSDLNAWIIRHLDNFAG